MRLIDADKFNGKVITRKKMHGSRKLIEGEKWQKD